MVCRKCGNSKSSIPHLKCLRHKAKKVCSKCHGYADSIAHLKCRKKHADDMNRWYRKLKRTNPEKYTEYRKVLLVNANRLKKEKPNDHIQRVLRWKLHNSSRYLFNQAKNRARRKKISFTITIGWIKKQIEKNKCAVTGLPFQTNKLLYLGKFQSHPFQPSIDRKNPNKGYTPSNARIVCVIYNYAKHTYSHKDVMKLARSLV